MAKVVKRKKLADFVIDEIKQMLRKGTIKEGDKLPNQNEFAEQLGVSRLSLREALHTLQMMGVVEQSPKKGTFIIQGDPDQWAEFIDAPLLKDEKATMELLEVRRIIESSIAEKAIRNITEEQIKLLSDITKNMELMYEKQDMQGYRQYDSEFHLQLVRSVENRYLNNMYMTIHRQTGQFIDEAFSVLPTLMDDSIKRHKLIVETLEAGDAKKAEQYMKEHISQLEKTFEKYYDEVRHA